MSEHSLTEQDKATINNLLSQYQKTSRGVFGGVGLTGISNFIYTVLSKLISGEYKILEADFEDFLSDVSIYTSGGLASSWFSKHFSMHELDKANFRSMLEKSDLGRLVLFYGSKVGFWAIEGDLITKKENIEQLSDRTGKELEEIIFEKVLKNEEYDITKSDTINFVVKNGFSFFDFRLEVSNRVVDILVDSSGTGFDFQIPKWAYDKYLNLQASFNKYHLTEDIYPSGEPKKLEAPKDYQVEQIINGVENLSRVILFGQKTDINLWPDVAIYDQSGEIIEGALERISGAENLRDSDISKYSFTYLRETSRDYKFLREPIGAFEGFLARLGGQEGDFSTSEMIIKSLSSEYVKILAQVVSDYKSGVQASVGIKFIEYFRNEENNIVDKIATLILVDKEIVRRKAYWDSLSDAKEDGELSAEEEERARKKSIESWAVGSADAIDEGLPAEDIKNRQKFFKQCALMMNLPALRQAYDSTIKNRFDGKLFDDRFYMAHCAEGGQEKLLSNLLTSADEQKLLEIPGHILSSLVPKVRLFKVTEKDDKMINTEFIFNATSNNRFERNQDREALIAENARREKEFEKASNSDGTRTLFLAEDFDKGNGCGLKEFSFEFNGTNPAEARNDIKATLKLYFQSFNDFIRERKSSNGKTYKYVDLIIQPKPDETSINIISDRHYEPSFYRIRADIGYHTDGIQDEDIRKAIEVSNKTMFLNMVDHDIQFKNDGSVEISISYRAYLESLLKHPRLDALASPELIKKREENAQLLMNELSNRRCTKERIQELQVAIAGTEDIILRKSLSSIIDRLRRRDVIYSTQINEVDRKHFLSKGFFRKCRLKTSISNLEKNIVKGKNNVDVGVVLNSELPENSEDFNFLNSTNNLVQFFFFGDLLYTILDCIYEKGGKLRKNSGFQNSKILLGSFEFDPFQITGVNDRVFNIAHIPISVDFFSRWFVDEVMAQKSTRKSFPVLNFVRSLTNQLIKPSLLETCVNRNVDKTLRFQTSQITAYHEGKIDPLNQYNKVGDDGQIGMEVMNLRNSGKLPLKGGGPDADLNKLYNYIVLSTAGSSLTYSGHGKYLEDIEQGRLHVNIGQNNGLVKSISLSKSDQQYIREARFFQQGIDGLLQLSAVYVATLEMFGNTLFYPGMEFFFNPYGLGGALHFGSPTEPNSVANKLGIGGYHTITSVRSSITPGSFKTTVAGQQYYSGDGSGNPNLRGKSSKKKEDDNLENYVPDNLDEDACETVISRVENLSSNDLVSGSDNVEDVLVDDPPESDNSTVVVEQDLHGKKPGDATTMIVDGIEEDGILILGGPYEDELFFEYIDSSGEGTIVIPTGMEYPEQ